MVVAQIGFSKSQKETQRVVAYLNGQNVTWTRSDGTWNGEFVSPTANRQQLIWFLAKLDCKSGDVIRLETSVFLRGRGPDEDRTRTVEFLVDEDAIPTEYAIRKVGDSAFPLLAGRFTLLSTRSKLEDRKDAGERLVAETQEQGTLE